MLRFVRPLDPTKWAGRISKHSIKEPSNTRMTTMGMLRMIFPMVPLPRRRGQKAATVVSTAKTTGRPTSRVPSTDPCRGSSPSSYLRNTFSPTTMASSTTMPNTIIKANREIMFMDTSNLGKSISPAMKEMGIPRVTQKASRTLRNSPRRMLTRTRPSPMFLSSSRMRLFNIRDLSR